MVELIESIEKNLTEFGITYRVSNNAGFKKASDRECYFKSKEDSVDGLVDTHAVIRYIARSLLYSLTGLYGLSGRVVVSYDCVKKNKWHIFFYGDSQLGYGVQCLEFDTAIEVFTKGLASALIKE